MKKLVSILLFIILTLSVTACYKPPEYSFIDPGVLPDKIEGKDYSPLSKYSAPVKLTVVAVNHELEAGVKPGLTPQNQSFNKLAKDVLNIELEYLWSTEPANYDQKLNLAIASRRVPDIFFTTMPTIYAQLRDAGSLANLSDSFHYLLPELQKMYLEDMPDILPTVMQEGKLWSLPMAANKYENTTRLYVRKDWLTKSGMNAPTTIEQLITVGEKFAAEKYGGDKTVPLAIHKNLMYAGSFGAQPFFHSFGAAPTAFVKDKNGNLIDGNTMPEMKTALGVLNTLYTKNILDREFITKDQSMIIDEIISGKVGMVYGNWWVPEYPLGMTVANVEGADWVSVDLPSYNGSEALPVVKKVMSSGYNLVSSKCSNPEAAVKLINLFYDVYYSDDAEARYGSGVRKENGFFHNFVPIKLWNALASVEEHKRVSKVFEDAYDAGISLDWKVLTAVQYEALDVGAKTKYDSELAIYDRLKSREKELHWYKGYPYYSELREGKTNKEIYNTKRNGQPLAAGEKRSEQEMMLSGWGIYNCMISPSSGYKYVSDLTASHKARNDEFYGSPTPAMKSKGDYLTSLCESSFSKIIIGEKPLNYFDEFVREYNKNGGNEVLTQAKDWFNAQPKKEKN